MNGLGRKLLFQGSINQLMLADSIQSIKLRRHHCDLKMIATAGEVLNAHLSIRNGASNGGADSVRLNHLASG